jgi:hypothetical protein
MTKKNSIELYKDYVKNNWNRKDLFVKLIEEFNIKSILYPGSYIHITPSFLVSKVTYVDTDKKAIKFFKDESVYSFIDSNKTYTESSEAKFYPINYYKKFEDSYGEYDLLVSQYAGFISEACKPYLRIGGILVANNSHGDAGLAQLDNDYELVAVANQKGDVWKISTANLSDYFVLKKELLITKEFLQTKGRGLGYKKTANAYIFKRLK